MNRVRVRQKKREEFSVWKNGRNLWDRYLIYSFLPFSAYIKWNIINLCLFERPSKENKNGVFFSFSFSFFFLNTFSCSRDFKDFVQKLMTPQIVLVSKDKSQNQNYLGSFWSDAAQTWHQQCTLGKKQNDTHFDVAMTLHSAPVPFFYEPNISPFSTR